MQSKTKPVTTTVVTSVEIGDVFQYTKNTGCRVEGGTTCGVGSD